MTRKIVEKPPCKNCLSKSIQERNWFEYNRPQRELMGSKSYSRWMDIDSPGIPRYVQEFRGELHGVIFTRHLYPVLLQTIRVRPRGGKEIPHAENFLRHVLRYFPEDNILSYALRKEIGGKIWGDRRKDHTRGIYDVMARSCLGSMEFVKWVHAPEKIFDLDHSGVPKSARGLMLNPYAVKHMRGALTEFEKKKWRQSPYTRKVRQREKMRSAVVEEVF